MPRSSMRRRLHEEETSGEENASGVSRTRKRQDLPRGKAPGGGGCYRKTLQEKVTPGGGGSRYRGFHEMGALWGGFRRKRVYEWVVPDESSSRRLQAVEAPRGRGCRTRILQEEEEAFGQLCSRRKFHEEAPIEGGWGSIWMRGSIRRLQEEKAPVRRESRKKSLQCEALGGGNSCYCLHVPSISDHSLIERRFPMQPRTIL